LVFSGKPKRHNVPVRDFMHHLHYDLTVCWTTRFSGYSDLALYAGVFPHAHAYLATPYTGQSLIFFGFAWTLFLVGTF